MKPLSRRWRRILSAPLVLLAALLIFFEEYAWDELAALFARLARLPGIRRIEAVLRRLPPWAALLLFLVPDLSLLPIKLLAVKLFATGHLLSGFVVIFLAKVLGTAVIAYLFTLMKPQLLQVGWFARLYQQFLRFRQYVFDWLAASPVWQAGKQLMARTRQHFSRPNRWQRMGKLLVRRWQHLRK